MTLTFTGQCCQLECLIEEMTSHHSHLTRHSLPVKATRGPTCRTGLTLRSCNNSIDHSVKAISVWIIPNRLMKRCIISEPKIKEKLSMMTKLLPSFDHHLFRAYGFFVRNGRDDGAANFRNIWFGEEADRDIRNATDVQKST